MAALIRDGFCVGRRFFYDDIQVVWLAAENLINVYGSDGELLKTVEDGYKPLAREVA